MAITKPEIIEKLTAAGIAHDPNDTVPNLKALLPAEGDDASKPAGTTPAADADAALPVAAASQPASTPKSDTKVTLPAKFLTDPEEIMAMPVETRAQRWLQFLAIARKDNPVRFDLQRENGEFDTIPANVK